MVVKVVVLAVLMQIASFTMAFAQDQQIGPAILPVPDAGEQTSGEAQTTQVDASVESQSGKPSEQDDTAAAAAEGAFGCTQTAENSFECETPIGRFSNCSDGAYAMLRQPITQVECVNWADGVVRRIDVSTGLEITLIEDPSTGQVTGQQRIDPTTGETVTENFAANNSNDNAGIWLFVIAALVIWLFRGVRVWLHRAYLRWMYKGITRP